jgi:hypothetical protein
MKDIRAVQKEFTTVFYGLIEGEETVSFYNFASPYTDSWLYAKIENVEVLYIDIDKDLYTYYFYNNKYCNEEEFIKELEKARLQKML